MVQGTVFGTIILGVRLNSTDACHEIQVGVCGESFNYVITGLHPSDSWSFRLIRASNNTIVANGGPFSVGGTADPASANFGNTPNPPLNAGETYIMVITSSNGDAAAAICVPSDCTGMC
jgi:hypothetical protein